MSDTRYTFSRADNNYFDGHDLHIVDRGSGATITVNRKEEMLAVNVKDEGTIHTEPTPVREAARKLGDDAVNVVYERVAESYWTWATMDLAGNHGFDTVHALGRSGGWMAVSGTENIEDGEISESPDPESPWGRFLALAFEAVAEIETYRERFRADLGEAATGLSEAHNEAARIRAASEPIKVLAVMWIDDNGQPSCNLYRNKPSLMGAMGSHYEGAATNALQYPGEPQLADSGETVAYLTVVE